MFCNRGKVVLPASQDPPQVLKNLLERADGVGKDFRDYVCFTSLHVTEDHSINQCSHGPPVFRIQGELHHRSGPLSPANGHTPTYAQLYFYDSRAALEYQCRQNSGLNVHTLETLQHMLLQHHQHTSIYRHAHEILEGYDPNEDPNEDVAIYYQPQMKSQLPGVDGDDQQARERDIVLQNCQGELQIISNLHPGYVPLYHVLLFPYGENGWHPGLTLSGSSNRRLTQTRYVGYRL